DGRPSRAILLYSWADRRTHEFFFSRDYPEAPDLRRIHAAATAEWQPRERLEARTGLDEEVFQKALEKLWIHGGVEIDPEENVRRGHDGWERGYLEQRRHRATQLELMTRFAQAKGCRMLHLVDHFGDQEDSGERCGTCDICAPDACVVRLFRTPDAEEAKHLRRMLDALGQWDGMSTGQLFKRSVEGSGVERRDFEELLAGLVRADLVRTRADSFEKNGRKIHFLRASLGPNAHRGSVDLRAAVTLAEELPEQKKPKRRRSKRSSKRRRAGAGSGGADSQAAAGRRAETSDLGPSGEILYAALKAWRLEEARRRRIPAFRILSNATLEEIVRQRPLDEEGLLQVRGIGPRIAEKHGADLLRVVADHGG
ncbi:MAG: HRDC domain-containing protein, partial [Holophagales bacterium]|nr:HRDC domain-containing protein [Holophagales bacterium]